MSDESQLQITPKYSDSPLRVRSGLITRGRRDAAALAAAVQAPGPDSELFEIWRLAESGDTHAQWALGDAYGRGIGVPQDDAEAIRWFCRAAGRAQNAGEVFAGYEYYNGSALPRDYVQAVKWLRKGTPSEFGVAELCLGECYFYGRGVQRDYAEAVQWLLAGLHREVYPDTFESIANLLGRIFSIGLTDPGQRAVKVLTRYSNVPAYAANVEEVRKEAEAGNEFSQFLLGVSYFYGRGVIQDDEEAANWFRRAADSGDTAAQFHLGLGYAYGRGMTQNYVQAYFWVYLAGLAFEYPYSHRIVSQEEYEATANSRNGQSRHVEPACRKEYQATISSAIAAIAERLTPDQISEIQVSAKVLYYCQNNDGDQAPKDPAVALHCWRVAAERGHATGQRKLGWCYANGYGVPRDFGEAAKWLGKAAEQGNSRAQHDLAVLYSEGNGVPLDYAAAEMWFRKAADQNNVRAQRDLGILYSAGIGVRLDYAEAANFFRRAASQGRSEAREALQRLKDDGNDLQPFDDGDDARRAPVIELMQALQRRLNKTKD